MKTITLEFEDLDWKILEDGIVDPTGWIQNAANVRMGKVKKDILLKEQTRLRWASAQEVVLLPPNE